MNYSFSHINSNTISRSIEQMQKGGRFEDGANAWKSTTKSENFIDRLFSFFGIKTKHEQIKGELSQVAVHFAEDVLKAQIHQHDGVLIPLLGDGPGAENERPNGVGFKENAGELEIYSSLPNAPVLRQKMSFLDLQVLSFKELLTHAQKSGQLINISQIPNYEQIAKKLNATDSDFIKNNVSQFVIESDSDAVLMGAPKSSEQIEADVTSDKYFSGFTSQIQRNKFSAVQR